MRAATDEMVDKSRQVTKSDEVWDIDRGHTPESPRLRRLSSMNDHHPTFWDYASAPNSPLPDAIADLVGPDVKFHQSKLNFKWSKGGDEVKWHQDISFWPHTNYSPCTAGTYIFDCNAEQGPLGVLPGSHNGTGRQSVQRQRPMGRLPPSGRRCRYRHEQGRLSGRAGRLDHDPQLPDLALFQGQLVGNPAPALLLNVYSAADAMPYTYNPLPSKYYGAIVRGKPARWAYHDPRPCSAAAGLVGRLHLDLRLQQEEDWKKDRPKAAVAM